ncbi:MAG: hypothetical protein AAF360_02710 [Pseudomonadota bacterium]
MTDDRPSCENPTCGKPFTPIRRDQKYCSKACNHEYRSAKRAAERTKAAQSNAPKPFRICTWCGAPFDRDLAKPTQTHCPGRKCKTEEENFAKGWAGRLTAGAAALNNKKIGPALAVCRAFNTAKRERVKANWDATAAKREERKAQAADYRDDA